MNAGISEPDANCTRINGMHDIMIWNAHCNLENLSDPDWVRKSAIWVFLIYGIGYGGGNVGGGGEIGGGEGGGGMPQSIMSSILGHSAGQYRISLLHC